VVSVALGDVQASLHAGVTDLQWVVGAYALTFACGDDHPGHGRNRHAGQPVTMPEVAAAAGVTARALQYAFRRHYDTTPTGYLRRVRLERAHRQLQAADPATGATIGEIARRWGWASPANFAAAYRKHFGVAPSHTLRT
jgi:transcriptional regulator GlxA family with amidase domain